MDIFGELTLTKNNFSNILQALSGYLSHYLHEAIWMLLFVWNVTLFRTVLRR